MGGSGIGNLDRNARPGEQVTGFREVRIPYKPLPSQRKFHKSEARFKGFSGPIGSGKSQALCQEAIRLSYFTNDGLTTPVHDYHGMPFYDDWTKSQFLSENGYALPTFSNNTSDPSVYGREVAFLSGLVGAFTAAIMTYVRASYPACRFEVLYPTDVNQTLFNQAVNFPSSSWTPSALTVLKTESFGFTFGRNLDKAVQSMDFGDPRFPASQRSHLVGIGDSTTAWLKEAQMAEGKRFESVVLFALDQFCLVGYGLPLPEALRRSLGMAF